MDRRGFGSGNIAKMCICLTLLLLSSTENSFVTTLPAAGESQAVSLFFTSFIFYNLNDKAKE